ncbi:MAG: hypothetical protein AAF705_04415 [Bacteroidota bacterium]
MQQKKYTIEGTNIRAILEAIKTEIKPELEETSATDKTFFYLFEKYSFAQNSDMSVMLLIDLISESTCNLTSIVAGGKNGFLRLDVLGRERSALETLERVLKQICSNNEWNINAQ